MEGAGPLCWERSQTQWHQKRRVCRNGWSSYNVCTRCANELQEKTGSTSLAESPWTHTSCHVYAGQPDVAQYPCILSKHSI